MIGGGLTKTVRQAYIGRMIRSVALSACLALAALPAAAEELNPDMSEGADLLEQGARLLFRGLMAEMAPSIDNMGQLAEILGDITAFHPPEVLPNGDIILRRKVPLIPGPPAADPGAEIDL